MITTAIALLALAGQAQSSATPTASSIISGMLNHYNHLDSLVGTIKLSIEAKAPQGSASQSVETQLQYEKPNKLFLKQDRSGGKPGEWVVSSDGKLFSYATPQDLGPSKSKRLVENVLSNSVADIYGASVRSITDRSVPLGIVISWGPELKRIVAEWPTYKLAGQADWNGEKVWKIIGKFREAPSGPIVGDFVLMIDKDGNLLEYKTDQAFATPTDADHVDAKHPTYLTNTWVVAVRANGTPDPSLFQVVLDN